MKSLEKPPHWFVVGGRKRAILAYAPPARRTCMRNRRASIRRVDALGPWVRARKVLRISSVFCSLQPFFAIEMASAAAAARSPGGFARAVQVKLDAIYQSLQAPRAPPLTSPTLIAGVRRTHATV